MSCLWRALLLATLGIALAEEAAIRRQHHLYGSISQGPTVEVYRGEPTLACTPDMFPPGGLHTVSVYLPFTPVLHGMVSLSCGFDWHLDIFTYSASVGRVLSGCHFICCSI